MKSRWVESEADDFVKRYAEKGVGTDLALRTYTTLFRSELLKMTGRTPSGIIQTVEIAAPGSPGANPGFDVTPARLVTGLITERGTCAATEQGLRSLFPAA